MPKFSAWLCGLLGIGLCAAVAGALLVAPVRPRGQPELEAARALWAARPFSRYRLALEIGTLGCKQELEVDGERVVAVRKNTCHAVAFTVSQIFDAIERDIRTRNGRCGTNGCGCDGVQQVEATYDSRLGFPVSKQVALNPAARWRFPDYWRQRLAGGMCTSREQSRERVTVIALQPIG
jgi:hypothetical protein